VDILAKHEENKRAGKFVPKPSVAEAVAEVQNYLTKKDPSFKPAAKVRRPGDPR
jgi:hypothetical protein